MRLVLGLTILLALSGSVMATGLSPMEETYRVDPCNGLPNCGVEAQEVTIRTQGVEVPDDCDGLCAPLVLDGDAGIVVEDASEPKTHESQQAAPAEAPVMDSWVVTGGLALGSLAMLIPVARGAAVLFLAPFAARLDPSKLLEDPTRQRIMDTVREQPGINLRALADEVDVAWGTILHHVHKLEKAKFLVTERVGRYRRYYVNGSGHDRKERRANAVLLAPGTNRVAEAIANNPGSSQREISRKLDLSPSTVLWHVRKLREAGLVHMERDGRAVRYTTSDLFQAASA